MTGFADHFSRDSALYAKFRPTYPPGLFTWLATLPAARSLAWDCGTGSGQAAALLMPHFGRVVASDPSRTQLAAADRAAGVHYFAALGESSALAAERVDLVTVAQALHWIDRDRFYRELDRIIAPGGALAVWSYGVLRSTPEVDAVIARFYKETVGPYWASARVHVEEGYRQFLIPIDEVRAPTFAIEAFLTLDELLGYVRTWSAVGRFIAEQRRDPVLELAEQLTPLWEEPSTARSIVWPLGVRAGRWLGMSRRNP